MSQTIPAGTAAHPPRPVPRPSDLTRMFWEGCARGELLFQRDPNLGTAVFPPQRFAPESLGELTWERSAGLGTVYSFTVVWRAQTPAFELPYVVAIVELEEGYTMLSNLVGCDPERVATGMPVRVVHERISDEIWLPCFEPADSRSDAEA